MKKRILAVVLVVAMILLLIRMVSCSADKNVSDSSDRESTVTTTSTTAVPVTTTAAVPVTTTTAAPKTSHRIAGVPLIGQMPAYPTGCESISSVMALQYAGYDCTPDAFIDTCLEQKNFVSKDGKRYGPDPSEFFVGSPRSAAGFGCMAPVIERALIRATGRSDAVQNLTGTDLETLCRDYIDNDVPVITWITIGMVDVALKTGWYLETTGEWYQWKSNEHCMLLVGYDENQYYFNDPYGNRIAHYSKSLVQNRFEKMGKQAVVVLRAN